MQNTHCPKCTRKILFGYERHVEACKGKPTVRELARQAVANRFARNGK